MNTAKEKTSIYSFSRENLVEWLQAAGEKPFRAKQIEEWLWKKKVFSFHDMSNLSTALKQKLDEEFSIAPLTEVQVEESKDKETTKFLWRLQDGAFVESVLIRAPGRYTVCVSSQVGCPARCGFCASGKKGLIRNLSTAEIISQVMRIDSFLEKNESAHVSHIVFMGMGEPFRNYDNVVKTIRLLVDPDKFGISQRRITVSTVGVVEGIVDFAREGLKVNLVLSLHAPNQAIRQKIIPYARQYDLTDVLAAMDHYHKEVGRDITYEYTLISGINDSVSHAEELCRLLRGKQCTVNLIPYNPVPGLRLKRPDRESIEAFREVLEKNGIVHTCRYTKGVDIAAACGQLALKEVEKDGAAQESVEKSPLNIVD